MTAYPTCLQILKLFDYKLAEFKINIISQWDKEQGYSSLQKSKKA